MNSMQVNYEPISKRNNSIVRISKITFQLIVNGRVTLEASSDTIRRVAEGFNFEDAQTAVEEMLLNDHDVAEFGINRKFMYSYSTYKQHKDRIAKMH